MSVVHYHLERRSPNDLNIDGSQITACIELHRVSGIVNRSDVFHIGATIIFAEEDSLDGAFLFTRQVQTIVADKTDVYNPLVVRGKAHMHTTSSPNRARVITRHWNRHRAQIKYIIPGRREA